MDTTRVSRRTDIEDVQIEARFRHQLEVLKAHGQDHLLRWWDELGLPQRRHLLGDLEGIPWKLLEPLIDTHVRQTPNEPIPPRLEPPDVFSRSPGPDREALYRSAFELGEKLVRGGKVAALTVAGGQGTRLGFEGPKGTLTITPVRDKTLFQLFAESILAARKRYDADIRWYIMTSAATHQQTKGFLDDHEYFGLDDEDVELFVQGMLPTFDFDGAMLMADKDRLSLAPDGHGGTLKSLVASGSLKRMQSRGVEVISYFQIDNPLVKVIDPLFIGLHALTGSDMSTKVAPKIDDLEKVGNVCVSEGRLYVIEYSNLPEELAHARTADGSRKFNFGSLGIHAVSVNFVDRIIAQRFDLPYHRAEKRITWLDENGFLRTPRKPNGIKLETFVFDALPLARFDPAVAKNPLLLEVDREEEFSPVKNAKGPDSVETATKAQVCRAARWLEQAGAVIPRKPDGEPDITVEISPSYATSAEQVAERVTNPPEFERGETIYIY